MLHAARLWAALLLALAPVLQSAAQTTAFAYRGQLSDGAQPANGWYDLQFRLTDAAVGGNYVGPTVQVPTVAVSNGQFIVSVDFGAAVFDGSARWLEMSVRTNGAASFAVLTPRQPITTTPYAIFAGTAARVSGPVPMSQLSGVLSATQLPAYVLTNGETGANLSGTFTGTVISSSVSGNGAGLTNVPVTAAQMDNTTWLGWLAGRFGAYSNINRFGTSNTFYALRNQLPITVLFEGNGWVNAGAVGGEFDAVLTSLTNMFGTRGFIGNPFTVWGTGHMYCPESISAGFGTQVGIVGYTTNWWPGMLVITNAGVGLQVSAPGFVADTYEMDWVSTPYGGTMTLATNNGSGWHVMTTLNGYSARQAGNVFKWTNALATANMTLAITNTAPGTNWLVAWGFINSTISNGVVFVQQSAQHTSATEQNAVPAPVRAPIYKSWNPTLILNLMPLTTGDGGWASNVPDSVANWNLYATNTPHADVVLCSQVAVTGVNLPFNVDNPYWKMQIARTNGWGYFDAIDMCSDYTNLLGRGIADGNSHLTAAGYQFYGNLLWTWLGLTERR